MLNSALVPTNPSVGVYVCGTPGTGKTLTVGRVIETLRCPSGKPPKTVQINCARFSPVGKVLDAICEALDIDKARDAALSIRKWMQADGERVVLVLDEVDFLMTKDMKILYALFEWPHMFGGRLVTVGIANMIDLPTRLLPWLRANGCVPETIQFAAYEAKALEKIVWENMNDDAKLSKVAVILAAKKVAAGSGDARLVLDVCRQAEMKARSGKGKDVELVNEVMGGRGKTKMVEVLKGLPIQQILAVIVVVNAEIWGGGKDRLEIGKLYKSFGRMCERLRVSCLRFGEFSEVCAGALASCGVLEVVETRKRGKKRGMEGKLLKLCVDVEEVKEAVQGRSILPSLLAKDGSC